MNIIESFLLGAVQGISEFLPISSSGHLVLIEELLGLDVENLLEFDIVLHLGTLLAILIYFRKDILSLFLDIPKWLKSLILLFKTKFEDNSIITDEAHHLISALIIATIPAGVIGILFGDTISEFLRSSKSVGYMMISTALVFVLAERIYERKSLFADEAIDSFCKNKLCKTVFIGFMQALALIPGVSRSGSTISAGLITGLKRDEAAKFSFFLGSIAIFGAFILNISSFSLSNENFPGLFVLIVGFFSSFLFGLLSIGFLMKFLKKHKLEVFSVYLSIVGLILVLFL